MATKTMTNTTNGGATAGNSMKQSGTKKTASSKEDTMNEHSRLKEFFHDEIKDIYWAEKQLVKTLPKMHKAASSTELKQAFADHLDVTRGHVERLEEVFSLLEKKPQAKKCEAMEGITKEGESIIEDTEAGTATRDVGLILAAQKVEHYEIATYGGLSQVAKTLGYDEIANILQSTLSEEKDADESLSKLAKASVNQSAAEED